ncbi:glycoside hydrolase family 2 TIM barrel-domain containing protein [Daejeonella sp.]|uniref:glycoside hydrolase family 2 TIM barrel-domain containing protein n=1 Tax=Daejeonella sp. TaxID=2805397 RepID=UPI0030C1DE41
MLFYRFFLCVTLLLAFDKSFSQLVVYGTSNVIDFDFDWRFHLGDLPRASNASYDDSQWRKLDLPHDWGAESSFDLDNASGWRGAYLPGGIGWYRKNFDWKKKPGQHLFIQFDGVYMNSEVWINGHRLGKRPYGYISFQYDLTPYLKDSNNSIAIRADNSKLPSGRWYTGSGIYRHVRLALTSDIFIPQWGTYVTTPRVSEESAEISVKAEIENKTGVQKRLTILTDILAPDGKLVNQKSTQTTLDTGLNFVTQTATILRPLLWSTETTRQYTVRHRIKNGARIIDEYSTRFGIRSIAVNAKDGFLLNGKKLKLNGVCNHHDAGPVGAAVPEEVLLRRLKLLKAMGCNAIRTAHNPAAPEFYAMCDSLGFLVLDEAFDGWDKPKAEFDYGLYFNEWWKADLTSFIKRDRNHPSVVIWSIGNEVPEFEHAFQKEMVDLLKGLDTTRPITQAKGFSAPYTDLAGFNGDGEMKGTLEKYHAQYPDKPLLGTEITHTLQTRGVYATKTAYRTRDFKAPWEANAKWENVQKTVTMIPDLTAEEVFKDNPKFYQSSYDNAIVRIGVRDQFKKAQELAYLFGTFRWTGFDYLGEAAIQPARTANFGIMDLAGFPKDHYYLYKSLWNPAPMVHLLPHWTHPSKEGVSIPMVAYSNAESVELFLNGKSLGEQKSSDELQFLWMVPYQKGTLKAIARKSGKVVSETTVTTAGAAAKIEMLADKQKVSANKRDVIHVEINITDKNGTMVPDAGNLLTFTLSGPGKIIGVENGDIIDFSPMKSTQRKAFKGKCLVMIQATGDPGVIKLIASAEGLPLSGISINSQKP